ncbi:hypothetical protein NHX12_001770 [Muraenolepis orangiensis]|uniref:DNA/RNA-binding protein Alba-like domain-containing protein n=1 Tax=Muraenolepis orangiensis TaxID=630683 RepID=A0A9Q0E1C8_9TELE|nr:hypothetical protein NHX12_001770 [Muraenolepis orangiensis]
MENYYKASTVEDPSPCPFADLPPDTPQVRVKDGSKIRNILGFALSRVETPRPPPAGKEDGEPDDVTVETKKAGKPEDVTMETKEAAKPLSRQIVFTATGKGISKAITCTEIVKRRLRGGVHQRTSLEYCALRELWEPLEPTAGLDSLTVSRNVPAIWILLSRDPLDPAVPGYQAPGNFDGLWTQTSLPGERHEKGGGGWGAGGGSHNFDLSSKADLTKLFNSPVYGAERMQRPLGSMVQIGPLSHSGVRLTLKDGSTWLAHKGDGYGVSSQTVVVDTKHMSNNWQIKETKNFKGTKTVGDFVKTGGSDYSLFNDNCHQGAAGGGSHNFDLSRRSDLTKLFNSPVYGAERMQRPLGSMGQLGPLSHSGVRLTLKDGSTWLAHKGDWGQRLWGQFSDRGGGY